MSMVQQVKEPSHARSYVQLVVEHCPHLIFCSSFVVAVGAKNCEHVAFIETLHGL